MGSLIRSSRTGTGTSITLPTSPTPIDGDLILVWIASSTGGGVAFTSPSGYTAVLAQKNATSSVGGRVGLFQHVWRSGDPTTGLTFGGAGGSFGWISLAIRSIVDAASLTLTATENEQTTASTTETFPQFSVADSVGDFKLALSVLSTNNPNVTPPAVTPNAANHPGLSFSPVATQSAVPSTQVYQSPNSDPGGVEAGSSNWTLATSNKSYNVSLVIKDGSGRSGAVFLGEVPIYPAVVQTPGADDEVEVVVEEVVSGGGVSIYTR